MQPLSDSLKSLAASAHDGWKPLPGGCMVYPELAAAGLWTTPSDLARFIIAHRRALRGEPNAIMSRQSAERMIDLCTVGSDFGEGFEVTPRGDEIYYGHRGGNYGFYSNLIINKKTGNGAVVMVNGGGDGVNSNLKREILNSIAVAYGWKNYLPPLLKVIRLAPAAKRRLLGRFWLSADNVVEIGERDGKYYAQSPDRGAFEIFPVAVDELVAKTALPLRFKLLKDKAMENDSLTVVSADSETKARRISVSDRIPFEYLGAGEIDKAVALYRELQGKNPALPDFRENRMNTLGYSLLNKNKMPEAVALFRLNAEWYPQSANTYDSLAEALLRSGDREGASENYGKALALNPGSRSAKEALQRLSENK
jgi:hypothetical protein